MCRFNNIVEILFNNQNDIDLITGPFKRKEVPKRKESTGEGEQRKTSGNSGLGKAGNPKGRIYRKTH